MPQGAGQQPRARALLACASLRQAEENGALGPRSKAALFALLTVACCYCAFAVDAPCVRVCFPRLSPCVPLQERGRINATGEFVVTSERTRTQGENYEDCVEKLHAMIVKACELPKATDSAKIDRIKKLSVSATGWREGRDVGEAACGRRGEHHAIKQQVSPFIPPRALCSLSVSVPPSSSLLIVLFAQCRSAEAAAAREQDAPL